MILPQQTTFAEQCLLGAILSGDIPWIMVSEVLTESDFSHHQHKAIFSSMSQVLLSNAPLNIMSVAGSLGSRGLLDNAGGLPYLSELAHEYYSSARLEEFSGSGGTIVSILANAARGIAKHANLVSRKTQVEADPGRSPIENSPDTLPIEPFNIQLERTIDTIDERFSNGNDITGLRTGFRAIDDMTSGLQRKELMLIGARPGMGKSTLLMNIVQHILLSNECPIVVFSTEQPSQRLIMRMISSLVQLEQTKIQAGKLDENDWSKLSEAVRILKDSLLFIQYKIGLKMDDVRSALEKVYRNHGEIGLIAIDTIQGLQITETHPGSSTTAKLKEMAVEFDCPVVATSRLDRECEWRPNKRPLLGDFYGSEPIEEDADAALFIYRDEVYNDETDHKGVAEIILSKNRNGIIGTSILNFSGKYARFEDLAFP